MRGFALGGTPFEGGGSVPAKEPFNDGIVSSAAHELAWTAVRITLQRHGQSMRRCVDGVWSYSALTTPLLQVGNTVTGRDGHTETPMVRLSLDLPERSAVADGPSSQPARLVEADEAKNALARRRAGVVLESWQLVAGPVDPQTAMSYQEWALTPDEVELGRRGGVRRRRSAEQRLVWRDTERLWAPARIVTPPPMMGDLTAPVSAEWQEHAVSGNALFMAIGRLLQPLTGWTEDAA
jgi:hypothetical protein